MKGKADEPVVVDTPISIDLVINVKKGAFSMFDYPMRVTAHADIGCSPHETLVDVITRAVAAAHASMRIEIPTEMSSCTVAKTPQARRKKPKA
jgi:hypothetical protein